MERRRPLPVRALLPALALALALAGCRIDGPVYLDSPRLAPPPCDCGPVALAPAPAAPRLSPTAPDAPAGASAVPALDPASRASRRARVALED